MVEEDDPLPRALETLTIFKYCKRTATALRKCQKESMKKNGLFSFSGSSSSDRCRTEELTYRTCAREKTESAISDLMAVSAKFCPGAVEQYQRCMYETHSPEMCEAEDLAALRCASKKILEAASASRG